MRIAFVSDAVYPYFKGGKEKRLYEFSTRLAKMGYDVHIYTMKWWEGPKDVEENGVQLHAICKHHEMYAGERRSIPEALIFSVACLKLLTKSFDIVDVDHMPFFPLYTMWAVCKLKDKKFFATWNEVWGRKYWVEYMGVKGNVAFLVERMSVLLPDSIISISAHTTNRLIQVMHCKKQIVEVACGLDLKQIQNVKPASSQTDILYSGRLLKHKRVDLLIKAIAKLKKDGQKVNCLIVGEGPERKRLESLTDRLGLQKQIEFHNFYEDHDEVFAMMKAAKVFALPSEREGFGIVAIEANACGRPVITNLADGNAAKDLIENGANGFLFNQTHDALGTVLSDALREGLNLEMKCLSFANGFDWGKLTRKLEEVYET